jgi:hypothetical protein
LPEQRVALENDYAKASELGANLLSSSRGAAKEAEESLQIRVAARTASITTVVVAGAIGLQTILRKMAEWIGADPEKVIVKPNMDFVPDKFQPKELLDFMAAKNADAPLSLESIHQWLIEKGVTELTLEEELKKIEEEETKLNEMRENEESDEMVEMRTLMLDQLRGQNAGTQNPNKPNPEDGNPQDKGKAQGRQNPASGNEDN